MKNIIRFFYVLCCALLLTVVTGCGSTEYSGSYSASYYGGNAWGYDNYYRSGVDRHYNRSAVRTNVSRPRGGGGGGHGRR